LRKFCYKFLREYGYISEKIYGKIYRKMKIAVERLLCSGSTDFKTSYDHLKGAFII